MSLLRTGPEAAAASLVLAHGAGAAMDSRFMNAFAEALAARGVQTLRFEFGYMAARRTGGGRKPPPRAETLKGEYRDLVATLEDRPLFIGGKSMGGRVASMIADDLYREGRIAGLVCLGYPFHPPAKPAQLRTAHLKELATPALICQGTRDPFGTAEEVESYALSSSIRIHWLTDGDHDFRPMKGSSTTAKANLASAADAVGAFMRATSG